MKPPKKPTPRHHVSTLEKAGKAIIIGSSKSESLNGFLQYLKDRSFDILTQETLSPDLYHYDFIILDTTLADKTLMQELVGLRLAHSKILIYCETEKQLKSLLLLHKKVGAKNCKIIKSSPSLQSEEDYIRWVHLLHDEKDFYLDMSPFFVPQNGHKKISFGIPKFSKAKKITIIAFVVVLALMSPFLLALGSVISLRACKSLDSSCQAVIKKSQERLFMSQKIYQSSRPVFNLFFLGVFADQSLSLAQEVLILVESGLKIRSEILKLPQNVEFDFKRTLDNITPSVTNLYQANSKILQNPLSNLYPLQNFRALLQKLQNPLQIANNIAPELQSSLEKNPNQKGVVFFYNNLEIRAGGGFLGSFALVDIKDGKLANFKIYDVYDADGQLEQHIAPPEYISLHMQQPFWFLRDSNISPDFEQNVKYAQEFLYKELKIQKIDFALGITMQAIENLLSHTGEVYLPEHKKKIGASNFALFFGSEIEEGFFPGDQTKKLLLSSLSSALLPKVYQLPPEKLLDYLSNSLTQKDIVIYSAFDPLQKALIKSGVSGKQILSQCVSRVENCEADYLFPFEANIGINKANYFVERKLNWNIEIDANANLTHSLIVHTQNHSILENKFSGTYKNWQSFVLDPSSQVVSLLSGENEIAITKNPLPNYQKVETLLTIPPQGTKTVTLNWQKKAKNPGALNFNFIIQKQIGLSYPLLLRIRYPKTWQLLDKNFGGLVKDEKILYNTLVNKDQIYVLEFSKLANFNK